METRHGKGKDRNVRVTVLLPTFNRPVYLQEAIKSVLSQTMPDWELLVINDGGLDVKEIVDAFEDERIRYFNRTANRGKASCLNYGLKEAEGEYIAYIDDDDLWYPNHLEVLSSALDAEPDVGAVYSDLYAVHFVKDEERGKRYPLNKWIQVSRDFNRDFMFYFNHTLHVSLMHRKSLALQAGGYDESVTVLIDWNMTRKLCFYTDFKYIPILTGEYYLPITNSGSDRISNLEREDEDRYKHNLRKIKADVPPQPWPKVERVAVILPVDKWTEIEKERIITFLDKLYYPLILVVVNNDPAKTESECREFLGEIRELKNLFIYTPPEPLNQLEAYRFGARSAEADYLYLPTHRAKTGMELRLITGMDYMKNRQYEALKWNVQEEKRGCYDILVKKERFLQVTDPQSGEMEMDMEIVPSAIPASLACDFWILRAEKEYDKGNYKLAYQMLKKADNIKDGGAGEQYLIEAYSRFCFEIGKYEEAEEKCRMLAHKGYGADNWIRLGKVLQIKGSYEEAVECYRKGIGALGLTESDLESPIFPMALPKDVPAFSAYAGMGECLIEMDRIGEASKMLHQGARIMANNPRPFLGFAKLFLKTGDLDKAYFALIEAINRDGKTVQGHRLLGIVHERKGFLEKGYECFLKAFELDKADYENMPFLYRIGILLNRLEETKEALEEFLLYRPGHTPTMGLLARLCCELGDYSGAEDLLERCLALDETNPELVALYSEIKDKRGLSHHAEAI